MKKLIKLAVTPLIGMSGLAVGATNTVKNTAEAVDKQIRAKQSLFW